MCETRFFGSTPTLIRSAAIRAFRNFVDNNSASRHSSLIQTGSLTIRFIARRESDVAE